MSTGFEISFLLNVFLASILLTFIFLTILNNRKR